jgi:hypothetical protein
MTAIERPDPNSPATGVNLVLARAKRHDSVLLASALDKVEELQPLPDAIEVHLDAANDSQKTREKLGSRITCWEIAHKSDKAPVRAGRRWPVERTNAWHGSFGRSVFIRRNHPSFPASGWKAEQAESTRPCYGLGTSVDVEFPVEVPLMRLDGIRGHVKLVGDLRRGQMGRQVSQYAGLPCRERSQETGRLTVWSWPSRERERYLVDSGQVGGVLHRESYGLRAVQRVAGDRPQQKCCRHPGPKVIRVGRLVFGVHNG